MDGKSKEKIIKNKMTSGNDRMNVVSAFLLPFSVLKSSFRDIIFPNNLTKEEKEKWFHSIAQTNPLQNRTQRN